MESDEEGASGSSMMEKETQKVEENLWKAGYRDGKDEGRKEGFQEHFDKGYEVAFQLSMQLGILRGTFDALIAKDATLATFLSPIIDRLKAEAASLTSLEYDMDKSEEENCQVLKDKYGKTVSEIKEQFINLYPYGEDQAEKILKFVENVGSP